MDKHFGKYKCQFGEHDWQDIPGSAWGGPGLTLEVGQECQKCSGIRDLQRNSAGTTWYTYEPQPKYPLCMIP